jgi:hypothetical protein
MPDADLSAQWASQIKDHIADSSKVREGLNDDEALSLIEWGNQQAHALANHIVTPHTPPPTSEAVDTKGSDLVRLMTRVTWLATYRHEKDEIWLTQNFKTINQLSQSLYGPNAPMFSDDEIRVWLATHAQYSNHELIRDLIARLTPTTIEPTPTPSPETPTLTQNVLPGQPTTPPESPAPTQDLPPADPAVPNTLDLVQNLLKRVQSAPTGPESKPSQGDEDDSQT